MAWDDNRAGRGDRMRRKVLGDAHVDRSMASKTAFSSAFQDYVTQAAWGDIWTRPGLSPRDRSMIVLAVTCALGAWDEFRLHLRGAVNNGLTLEEIRETLMQCAVYAGVPRANSAFKEAAPILKELGVPGA